MIYITYRKSIANDGLMVNNVWSINSSTVQEDYILFMQEKAKEINVVINPHWLNIMNWQDHNQHLTIGEYSNKQNQWKKILRQWNIDKFISEVLKGRKERYIDVVRF